METEKEKKNYIHRDTSRPYWDWFAESPIEIVLVVFILVFFIFMPREGCGISPIAGPSAAQGESLER